MKVRLAIAFVGFSILLAGCSKKPGPAAMSVSEQSAADEKAIRKAELVWAEDWVSKDLDRIVSHYADDAVVDIPGAPLRGIKGNAAIRSGIAGLLGDRNVSLTFTPRGDSSDLLRSGTFSLSRSNPGLTVTGDYMAIYRKLAAGAWVVARQRVVRRSFDADPIPGMNAEGLFLP